VKEEDLIAYLLSQKGQKALDEGIGDDCAILVGKGGYTLLTTDALVEGVHFDRRYFSAYFLGRKLAVVNLSDMAAMGGCPQAALLTLGLPSPPEPAWVQEFFQGLLSRLGEFGAKLVGGDTVRNPGGIFLNLSLVGHATWAPVRRDKARPGEIIFVSRPLGASAAALELLQKGVSCPDPLIQAHLDPEPELLLGQALAQKQLISALIDISDGLALDLKRLCRASGVGAILFEESIPFHPLLSGLSLEAPPLHYALFGGEDYALLFTSPPASQDQLTNLTSSLGRILFPVGRICAETGLWLKTRHGDQIPLDAKGFDHFAFGHKPSS